MLKFMKLRYIPLNKKKRMLTLILLPILFFIYIFSYCFILPISEKLGISNVFYILYEPVEFMRTSSDFVWNITEDGYLLFGGKILEYNRYYFHTKRKSILYDGDTIISKGFFCNAKYDGTLLHFFPDGKIASIEHRKNDKYDGKSEMFYENGKKQFECNHINGKLVGPKIYYDIYGNIIMVENFSDDGEQINCLLSLSTLSDSSSNTDTSDDAASDLMPVDEWLNSLLH